MADFTFRNVSIYNPVTKHTVQISPATIPNDPFVTIAATDSYVITEADVLAALANESNLAPSSISVSSDGDAGTVDTNVESNYLNVYKENLIASLYDPFVTVSIFGLPSEKVSFGDEIQYTAQIVNNTETTINNLSFTASLANYTQTLSLAPHETKQVNLQYTVLLSDMYQTSVSETCTVSGKSFANTDILESATSIVNIEKAAPKIRLSYVDAETGYAYTYANSGENASLIASIANIGNVPLASVTLHDNATNADYSSNALLAVNESVTFEISPTVSNADSVAIFSGTASAIDTFNLAAVAEPTKPIYCIVDSTDKSRFSFNAYASSSYSYKAGIPFNLNEQSGITLIVDWGDGNTDILTSNNYSNDNVASSIHTYATEGTYEINIMSNAFNNAYVDVSQNTNSTTTYQHLYYFKNTIRQVNDKLPKFKGTQKYSGSLSSYDIADNALNHLFYYCTSLQSIPSGLFDNNTTATSFERCFYYCTSLQSIPSGLFDNNTAAEDFTNCFDDCTSLQSIPAGLFDNCTAAINFYGCFNYCSNLRSIPAGLFDNCTAATNFGYCFRNCRLLASIPSGLFDNNTALTNLYYCFSFCYAITSIPAGLFDNNTAVTNFEGCFCQCTALTAIPQNLFKYNTAATTFASCFYNCNKVASIPAGLFDSNTAVTSFVNCFYTCTSIASIPAGLFDSNTAVTSFASCFRGCKFTSIPSGLFDNNVAVTSFSNCFYSCTSLQSIPSGLFASNTAVTDFSSCFYGCKFTSIPSGLFDNNVAVTSFSNCFSNCSILTTIPARLFANCTAATTFNSCFYYCSNLRTIGAGLFAGCSAATNFSSCFYECSSLQTIGEGLFAGCSAATNFSYCFYYCSSLQTIGEGLFAGCSAATNFSYCFYYCSNLRSIPSGIFDDCTAATTFTWCFYYCRYIQSVPENLFKYNTAVTNFSYCLYSTTNLTNFTIHIGSSIVTNCNAFINSKSGNTRIIYVPASSTTYTNFNSYASSYNYTLIGE